MDRITRIAKSIFARSQMMKKCRLSNEDFCVFTITEGIFLQDSTYGFEELKSDVAEFLIDVQNELSRIGFVNAEISENSVGLTVDQSSCLLMLDYDFRVLASDEQIELAREHEWIVDDQKK